MRIALFGGTGYVGCYLVDELLNQGHQPVLLVREGSEGKVQHREKCIIVTGNVLNNSDVAVAVQNADGVIYTIGLLRQFPARGITFQEYQLDSAKRVIDAAIAAKVNRFILMSANGVKRDGTLYQTTKYQAEKYLKATGLNWTIFRPSVIFGDPRGRVEFCKQLRDDMLALPIPAPMFYEGFVPKDAGQFMMSPIHVTDVATLFVRSLPMVSTFGQTYHLGGGETLSWREIVGRIAAASKRHKWMVPVPAMVIKLAAAFLDRFSFFPITRDQLTMLMEGNICESRDLFELMELVPKKFDDSNLAYLGRTT